MCWRNRRCVSRGLQLRTCRAGTWTYCRIRRWRVSWDWSRTARGRRWIGGPPCATWTREALTSDSVVIGVQAVRITWVSVQVSLRSGLVRKVVAILIVNSESWRGGVDGQNESYENEGQGRKSKQYSHFVDSPLWVSVWAIELPRVGHPAVDSVAIWVTLL